MYWVNLFAPSIQLQNSKCSPKLNSQDHVWNDPGDLWVTLVHSPELSIKSPLPLVKSCIYLFVCLFHKHLKAYFVSGPILSAKEIRVKTRALREPTASWLGVGEWQNRQPCCRSSIIFCPIPSLTTLFLVLGMLSALFLVPETPSSPDQKLKSYLQSYCRDKRLVCSFLFHITSPSAYHSS